MLMVKFFLAILLLSFSAIADESRNALKGVLDSGEEYTLSNGLKVILLPRADVPIFSVVLAVRAGGVDEVRPKTGISHMLEHMAFKGTSKVGTKNYEMERPLLEELEQIASRSDSANSLSKPDQIRWQEIQSKLSQIWESEAFTRELERRGASGLNATTDKEFTTYYVQLPKKYFSFWAETESNRIVDPVMRQFYQEREVVREERRMRSEDDPGGKLYEKFLETAFKVHPYKNPVIGYDDEIKRLTATELKAFHDKYYVASNMVLSLVGDVSRDDIPILEKYFGRIARGSKIERNIPEEPIQTSPRELVIKSPHAPMLAIGFKKPSYPHPDDPKISLVGSILAGGTLSPLYKSLVEEQGLASAVDYDETPGVIYPSLMFFGIVPKQPHTARELLDAFKKELEIILAKGFTEEDVLLAKRTTAREFVDILESNSGMARILAHSSLAFGDWKALLTWFDEAMLASKTELEEAARKYLINETQTVGLIESVQP